MARVYKNWERLVRATLEREQLRDAGRGHERRSGGIAGAVQLPPSLDRATNIDAILQAADEIQEEDPTVSRILCEQAYGMAQNLDPNSEGRGVLQFKTGLMSVIKQKLAKRDGGRIDRNRDIEHLWEFYQLYKRRHKVDDIFSSSTLGNALGMKKVLATLRALVEVMEVLSKDADPDGVGRLIKEELRRIKNVDATISGELTPYNIVPLEAPSFTNAIGLFPEVRGAISAIRYTEHFPRLPSNFSISGQRDPDMFDLLEYVFGFQCLNLTVMKSREKAIMIICLIMLLLDAMKLCMFYLYYHILLFGDTKMEGTLVSTWHDIDMYWICHSVTRLWFKGGIGGLLRDEKGVVLGSFSERVGSGSPIMAELLAMKRGLMLFLESGLSVNRRLILESDSVVAVDWIKNPAATTPLFMSIVKDITSIVVDKGVIVRHVLRAVNWEADEFAKLGIG
ncbi:hypothetical protein F3Y22_tig00110429pilonHSYRG00130 [Hibiscus syriacus]|uniref:RNase H type-1 domain-containing protein n=1 Tax=Hibiscus syriacus TaxID=106335 RepID=A0A6A3APL5_HIBSY|nr:hypothetical protein F3Y22_tig00110429pilonHSYRG00130 [Hibiscus syriacus]